MSEQPSVSATGKSKEEVAFDLLSKLKGQGVWGERNISAILDMYAECLVATKGQRIVEGLKAAEQPLMDLKAPTTPQQAAPVQPAAVQAPQVYSPAPQQAQPPQPVQAAQAQPVHAQQQALQQAFKQG